LHLYPRPLAIGRCEYRYATAYARCERAPAVSCGVGPRQRSRAPDSEMLPPRECKDD
jgi:hypothetical protein